MIFTPTLMLGAQTTPFESIRLRLPCVAWHQIRWFQSRHAIPARRSIQDLKDLIRVVLKSIKTSRNSPPAILSVTTTPVSPVPTKTAVFKPMALCPDAQGMGQCDFAIRRGLRLHSRHRELDPCARQHLRLLFESMAPYLLIFLRG